MADAENIGGYRLMNLMMTGQSSQVWEVVEQSSFRHFAMKLLLPEKAALAEHRKFLYHEAKVGQDLAHPNIIKIVTVHQDNKNPYFVMEFFPGGSLKARLMRKQMDFLKEYAHPIFRQAATALAFMNAQGWVHRDVKPDNILCNSAGEVKLIDFALARRVERPGWFGGLFRSRPKAMGTRSYMSPEQIKGDPLDGRADIYSFGATLYELTTGRPPFRGASAQELLEKHFKEKPASPDQLNPDLTKEFCDLVLKMLRKKRDERPGDFHEVLIALKQVRVYKSIPNKAAQAGMG
jgi:serine/threonine-protein kinase